MTAPTALPPDPDGQNDLRAGLAEAAIERFRARAYGLTVTEDDSTTLADLFADLMHWADRTTADFAECLARGERHYQEETTADEPDEKDHPRYS